MVKEYKVKVEATTRRKKKKGHNINHQIGIYKFQKESKRFTARLYGKQCHACKNTRRRVYADTSTGLSVTTGCCCCVSSTGDDEPVAAAPSFESLLLSSLVAMDFNLSSADWEDASDPSLTVVGSSGGREIEAEAFEEGLRIGSLGGDPLDVAIKIGERRRGLGGGLGLEVGLGTFEIDSKGDPASTLSPESASGGEPDTELTAAEAADCEAAALLFFHNLSIGFCFCLSGDGGEGAT